MQEEEAQMEVRQEEGMAGLTQGHLEGVVGEMVEVVHLLLDHLEEVEGLELLVIILLVVKEVCRYRNHFINYSILE